MDSKREVDRAKSKNTHLIICKSHKEQRYQSALDTMQLGS